MAHHSDDQMSTLADLSQTVDSPMLRAMSGERVDTDTHALLAAIAAYEQGLSHSERPARGGRQRRASGRPAVTTS